MHKKNYFRAIVAYDGTHYFGWQTTRSGPSIQEAITFALLKAAQEEVIPEAASRTDRGVHAEGQSIAFALSKPWDLLVLRKAMNAHLPPDIRIKKIEETVSDFHPTLHAVAKEYHYRLSLNPFQVPMDRFYAWHFPHFINHEELQKAAALLLGTHDFSSFTSRKDKQPVCTIFSIEIKNLKRCLQITMKGDRFLYKMARTIIGTLVYIGAGKLQTNSIQELFTHPNRKNAGMTAPAHGLFLGSVIYSQNYDF